jgi:hypothetical protein
MSHLEPSGPDLDGVVADANAVGLPYVVIGGFSVIANGFVRATKDSDLLVPDGPDADEAILRFLPVSRQTRLHDDKALDGADVAEADHLRVRTRHGIVDVLRSVVGFKRLAGRPQDKRDLEELEDLYGELPMDPIPGLDS